MIQQTHSFYVPLDFVQNYPGEPVPEPIWILLKQETVSGSGISWAICKSSPRPIQVTMSAPHHSVFYRLDRIPFLLPNQQHQSTEAKIDTTKCIVNVQEVMYDLRNYVTPFSFYLLSFSVIFALFFLHFMDVWLLLYLNEVLSSSLTFFFLFLHFVLYCRAHVNCLN